METHHQERIQTYTDTRYLHKIINLDIEDIYQYMQPELIAILKIKVQATGYLIQP